MSNSQSAHDVTACDDDDGYGEIGVYARRTGIVAAAGDIHQDSHLVHEMCWRCACLLYAHTEMLMPILMFRLFVFFVCLFFRFSLFRFYLYSVAQLQQWATFCEIVVFRLMHVMCWHCIYLLYSHTHTV